MAVSDYSTSAGSNTSISGTNIAEGCSPGNLNNAIRQLMADVRAFYDAPIVGLTASAAELNILDGATLTTAELNVLDGIPGTLTATEIGYLDGVTSAIQTQLNGKQATITTLALANGGTGAALVDPNADRLMFWDDSAGSVAFLEAGNGLTISGTTLTSYAVDFTSSESNLATSTTYTFAHGLGAVPRDFRAYLRAASAVDGYSTDMHVLLTPYQDSSAQGVGLWADATNVYVRTAGTVATYGPSGYGSLTAGSSWKVYARAWR